MTYTLILDAQSVQIIGESLAAQPYKAVAPLIANIQAQINAQEAAAVGKKAEPSKDGKVWNDLTQEWQAEPEKPQEPANA